MNDIALAAIISLAVIDLATIGALLWVLLRLSPRIQVAAPRVPRKQQDGNDEQPGSRM